MGVGEEGAVLGDGVDVRGDGIGVAVHAADPVVLVIDGDEEDVGFFGEEGKGEGKGEEEALHDRNRIVTGRSEKIIRLRVDWARVIYILMGFWFLGRDEFGNAATGAGE